jgi:DNA-binding MarR family transcriptional regulator
MDASPIPLFLRERMDALPLKDIAGHLGYSPMMITKAKDELVASGLCKTVRAGRSLVLKFQEQGRSLWEHAKPHLSSPVQKVHWVQWEEPSGSAIPAGLSALSQRTMIADDPVPTKALDARTFRADLEKELYHKCQVPEEGNVCLEVWRYNPLLLGDRHGVDSLSLYMSLCESYDERVQQQLKMLVESMSW